MTVAFVFPGQGAQSIGMSSALAAVYPSVKTLYQQASDHLHFDLWKLVDEGDARELSRTENTQPALLTAGVAAWEVWNCEGGIVPDFMAGHSLGEYTALTCANAMDFDEAITLVRDRGRIMQQAMPEGSSAMAAIIGLDSSQLAAICQQSAEDEVITPVNFNTPQQTVIAGHCSALERAIALAQQAGARKIVRLPVSVAAHSPLMQEASQQLANRLQNVTIRLPEIPVIHNYHGEIAQTISDVRAALTRQLYSPVHWVDIIESIHARGVKTIIESGPAKTLCGMIRKIVKGIEVGSIDQPQQLHTLIRRFAR